jgi:hypothetical protein
MVLTSFFVAPFLSLFFRSDGDGKKRRFRIWPILLLLAPQRFVELDRPNKVGVER